MCVQSDVLKCFLSLTCIFSFQTTQQFLRIFSLISACCMSLLPDYNYVFEISHWLYVNVVFTPDKCCTVLVSYRFEYICYRYDEIFFGITFDLEISIEGVSD
jgi:hypothetical protein